MTNEFCFDDNTVIPLANFPAEFAPLFTAMASCVDQFQNDVEWDVTSFASLLVLQFLAVGQGRTYRLLYSTNYLNFRRRPVQPSDYRPFAKYRSQCTQRSLLHFDGTTELQISQYCSSGTQILNGSTFNSIIFRSTSLCHSVIWV